MWVPNRRLDLRVSYQVGRNCGSHQHLILWNYLLCVDFNYSVIWLIASYPGHQHGIGLIILISRCRVRRLPLALQLRVLNNGFGGDRRGLSALVFEEPEGRVLLEFEILELLHALLVWLLPIAPDDVQQSSCGVHVVNLGELLGVIKVIVVPLHSSLVGRQLKGPFNFELKLLSLAPNISWIVRMPDVRLYLEAPDYIRLLLGL